MFLSGRWGAVRALKSRSVTVSLVESFAGRPPVRLGHSIQSADVPHSRPVEIHGSASDEALATTLGLSKSRYEGPTGVVSVFHEACARAGLKVVTFWASVPHYVAQPPCPKATLSLLHRAEDALDIAIPLGDLPEQARAWEHGVDELAREDTEIAEYISSLEEREDESELPEASGDAIAKAFERYLRRRDNPPAGA